MKENKMYLVTFDGKKINLSMDESAQQAVNTLLMHASSTGAIGLVNDQDESFQLRAYYCPDYEETKMKKNTDKGKPPRHMLPWSAKDYMELAEHALSRKSLPTEDLAIHFGRSYRSIVQLASKIRNDTRHSLSRSHEPQQTMSVIGAPQITGEMEDMMAYVEPPIM